MQQKNTKTDNYYIGLDLGTDSVGWAVTDKEYRIKRAKGKDMWGSRLFDSANTAVETRTNRVARRRRQRETARLGVLRELFSEEIAKVDPHFYLKMKESKYYMDDRSEGNQQKYALFSDADFTDKEYYEKYPTIFHLRNELIHSEEKHDVRLVYLALVNMFKHRGHFLNGNLSADTSGEFESLFDNFLEICEQNDICFPRVDAKEFEQILGRTGKSRTAIMSEAVEYTGIDKKMTAETELLKMLCGLTAKMSSIFKEYEEDFKDEDYKNIEKISFRDGSLDEKLAELEELVGDEIDLILAAKEIHDEGLLANIKRGHRYICEARVDSYEQHKKDLKLLKKVLKKYNMEAYNQIFRTMEEGSYSAYVGSVNADGNGSAGKKTRRVDAKGNNVKENDPKNLYKNIEDSLKGHEDDEDVKIIFDKMKSENFLPKQLTASNGVIPNQIYVSEMKAILDKAAKYLDFLNNEVEKGLRVRDCILKLFSFQIPYYVGPLGNQHRDKKGYHVWSVRKSGDKIYPWNFEEVIDVKASAEKFISRMVNHCSYLSDKTVLPKRSLLYEKYMVLNELNNLKINGQKPSVVIKQRIYNELFMTGKKVKMSDLLQFLRANGIIAKDENPVISGIDNGFQASLTSIDKFNHVFEQPYMNDDNIRMIEKIIYWSTIFGNDKKFLKEKIRDEYGEDRLSKSQLKKIMGFKFADWGRLSKEFLEIEGCSTKMGDGEIRTLINALWETNDNLMELLSSQYTYMDSLSDMVKKNEKPLCEWTPEDLDDTYLSAPSKRMVWQTLKIVNEIQEIEGHAPERVFVEMARDAFHEEQARKSSRKKKLIALYDKLGKEGRAWKKELADRDESEFKIKKLYLYYTQMGRCMYTGEEIVLDDLMNSNLYDIDHIYPRHFIKDDSLDNNLVLVRKEKNGHKSDNFPIEGDIRKKCFGLWKGLREKGLISETKFNRLTRTEEFTDEDKAGFINRQLVETRQGSKAVTEILQEALPDTKIVFSKAGLVSEFRKKFDIVKCRSVNDLHHAQDAYLNIVVGNTYFVKFTDNPLKFIKAGNKAKDDKKRYGYHMEKVFDYTVYNDKETAWVNEEGGKNNTIAVVKKYAFKTSAIISRKRYAQTGAITKKDTIYSSKITSKAKEGAYLALKTKDDVMSNVKRYGGKAGVTTSAYSLVQYTVSGKKVRTLEAIPNFLGRIENISTEQLTEYFEKKIQEENTKKEISDVSVRYKTILMKSLVKIDGYYYYIGGRQNDSIMYENGVVLQLPYNQYKYVKSIEKVLKDKNYMSLDSNGKLLVTKENNFLLYIQLLEKMRNPIYAKRRNPILSVCENEEKFRELGLEKQLLVLQRILNYFGLNSNVLDLRDMGGSKALGRVVISKNITGLDEYKLINSSVTGLIESEVDLLTV